MVTFPPEPKIAVRFSGGVHGVSKPVEVTWSDYLSRPNEMAG